MKTRNQNRFAVALAAAGFTVLVAGLTACDQVPSLDSDKRSSGTDQDGYFAGYELGIRLAELQQQQPGFKVVDEAFEGMLDALADMNQHIDRTELCAPPQPVESQPDDRAYNPAESVQPSQTDTRPHNIFKADFTRNNFAALNAEREGVVTLPSGVQYEVLKAGNGEPPEAGDAVVISYQASFADGTVVGTTDDGGAQYIALDDIVVPGLKEALLLMNAGARWQVVVPPSVGFTRSGNRKLRRRDLIYDIMLVSIDRAPSVAAGE